MVPYFTTLATVTEWRALSGVTVAGVKDSCESKGEPEVDQTNGPPFALV